MNWDHRFKAVSQAGPLAGHVFRVVEVNPQDMVLWGECGKGGAGMTWRGELKQFKRLFTLAPKVGTG
jgi:hypothetical protein